ncbi:insulin-degrading enzyme-like [Temnothorax longispinosus]|uniref:insulin-degrading enzyme-like n=1 Tax=Temnothorax longispinosus TaxID=300112 RepID=UPI003A998EAD
MAAVIDMSTNKCVEKRYNNIKKRRNDSCLYRGLLLTNKMKVLLISTPTADMSAAIMDVNMGCMCDPEDLPGLAHLCEHLLFLGTEKYSHQDDYSMYVMEKGGTYTGITRPDHTIYYFHVIPEKLEGALDRLSQFFIAPLFTKIKRGINDVNKEYVNLAINDSWRLIQFEKSSARPDHPYSKFNAGDKETLNIIPKEEGINLRDRLKEFHKKYYSANIMTLCIYGKESLDELENMVVKYFCDIQNNEVEVPIYPEHPFGDEHFGTIWYIVPLQHIRELVISFPYPDIQHYYRASTEYYFSYLLECKGKGSLWSALYARNWCTLLKAQKTLRGKFCENFKVIFYLTEEGIRHTEDIIQLLFQYINMLKLKGPIEWIYDEYRDITNMNFHYKEESLLNNYVASAARALQEYPMDEVLCAEIVCTDQIWRPDLIEQVVEYLKPQNIKIYVIAIECEIIANEREYWCGVEYKKVKVPKETMNMWNHAGYSPDLTLPSKNEFIATTLDIKPQTNVERFPILLENRPFIKLWYKKDDEFLVPKAIMLFKFYSPLTCMDPLSFNLTYIYVELLLNSYNTYTDAAKLAGLEWKITSYDSGIILSIQGYNDKQYVLLEKIIDQMLNCKVDPIMFKILKDNYIRYLANWTTGRPYYDTLHNLKILLSDKAWYKDTLLEYTAYLSVGRFQQFVAQLFSKVHVECLIHGNVTATEAKKAVNLIESKLKTAVPNIVPVFEWPVQREIKLEDGCHFLFEVENKLNNISCTTVYYATGLQSTESNMLLELLAQIIAEPCCNTFKTHTYMYRNKKKGDGHIAYSGIHKLHWTQGLYVIVQNDKHPQYVEKQIDSFVDSMLEYISTMSAEEFEKHKKTLAKLRLEKPKTLIARNALYWNEIMSQQYNFNRVNIEVAYLETITQQELLSFYKENVYNKTRSKVSIHMVSTAISTKKSSLHTSGVSANSSTNKDVKKINDIVLFKKSQSLYCQLLKPF